MTLTKKQMSIAGVGLVIVLVVVLIIVFAGGKDKAITEDVSELAITPMKPVVQGDMRYAFDAISWDLEVRNEDTPLVETKVAFYFDNFTRRENGTPAEFARPFYIGSYQGNCAERSGTNADDESLLALGIPLGFVFCDVDGQETFIGLFQKEALVSAYRWDTNSAEPVHIRDINITTIVKNVKNIVEKIPELNTTLTTYPPRKNKVITSSI